MKAAPALWWSAIVALGLFELAAASLALRPRVTPQYQSYFIDKVSDCWPHTTPGSYTLGQELSFIEGRGAPFTPNKICGWFYLGDDGTWSYGDYSLLLLAFPPVEQKLTLTLTAAAMTTPALPTQRVVVVANGVTLGTLSFSGGPPQTKTLDIPATIADSGLLQLRFNYLDARPGSELGPNEDAHLRAIRMVSLTLAADEK